LTMNTNIISSQTSFPWWWRQRWSAKLWAFIHNWHGLLPEKNLSNPIIA
jgi:hypothetical protein